MPIETIPFSNLAFIERRLFMNYYPGKWAGLSEWAFRRYIVLCSNIRFYKDTLKDEPYVFSGINHMERGAGMTGKFQTHYEAANEELCAKNFIKRRPDLDNNKLVYYEILTLPDYIGGQYIPSNTLRTRENLEKIQRGYFLIPRELAAFNNIPPRDRIFHNALTDAWVVLLKLYEYNHLTWSGVDPDAIRLDHGSFYIHPSLYEELYLSEEEFTAHVRYWLSRGLIEINPIRYTVVDHAGWSQIVYLDDTRDSDIHSFRLKYQPRNQYDEWRTVTRCN